MIKFNFRDDVYCADIYVYIGCSYEDLKRDISKDVELSVDGDENNIVGAVWEFLDSSGFLVWVKEEDDFGTIIHESLHLALKIFNSRYIKMDYNNQEPFVYYATYIIMKLKDELEKGGNNGQN